jgi:hypothetical protein
VDNSDELESKAQRLLDKLASVGGSEGTNGFMGRSQPLGLINPDNRPAYQSLFGFFSVPIFHESGNFKPSRIFDQIQNFRGK